MSTIKIAGVHGGYDGRFSQSLISVGIPVTLQSLGTYSLNLIDGVMVGQLGEVAIAAVGVANQAFFVLMLLLFGISNGASIFIAQYWGNKSGEKIRNVLAIALLGGGGASAIFTLVVMAAPQYVARLFTQDVSVIQGASEYFRIVCWSYFFTAVSIVFSCALRNIGHAKVPMIVTFISLGTNTLLNYLLIFGLGPFPEMGIQGAALATVLARLLECMLLVGSVYMRFSILRVSPADLSQASSERVKLFVSTSMPLILSEVIWALGVSAYSAVYGRMGTDALVVISIASGIQGVAFALFLGISDACAVVLGNLIGEGKVDQVSTYARRYMLLAVGLALCVGVGVYLSGEWIISLYKVSSQVHNLASDVLLIMALMMWSKVSSLIILAVMRSGGNTRFVFFMDAGSTWVYGVPVAVLCGLFLKLSMPWVFFLVHLEDVVKSLLGLLKMRFGQWIHRLG